MTSRIVIITLLLLAHLQGFTQGPGDPGWEGGIQYFLALSGTQLTAINSSDNYAAIWTDQNNSSVAPPAGGTWLWTVSGGTLSNESDVSCTVTWNSPGTHTLQYEYTTWANYFYDTREVAVAYPATPVTTFTIVQNCNSTTVTRSGTPPGGLTWYWQTSSFGTSTSLGSGASITRTTAGNLYLRARMNASPFTWSETALLVGNVAIVSPLAAPAPATDTEVISGGNVSVAVSVTPVSGATSYKWYTTATGGSPVGTTTNATYSPVIAQTTTFYAESVIGACSSNTRTSVTAIVYPEPVIEVNNNGRISLHKPVTLSVTNFPYSTFQWLDANGNPVPAGTSSNWSTTSPGVYRIRVTKGTSPVFVSAPFQVTSGLDGLNMNYVVSNAVLVPGVTSAASIDTLTVESVSQNVQYFDGLGRPLQSVSTQASPAGNDLIQPVVYDPFGREAVKYLPYVEGADGLYKLSPVGTTATYATSPQASFYNGSDETIAASATPFAVTIFETSPLNRVVKQGAPGTSWQPDATNTYASTDHTIKRSYEFNNANEVLYWTYKAPGATLPLGLVNAGTGTLKTYYDAGQLIRNKTKDEQGHEVIEYTNKLGQVVLKRVQAGTSQVVNDVNYASTYYIYDDVGNLVTVIPPEATKLIMQTSPASEYFDKQDPMKDAFLKNWAFRYRYDARGRLIMKQVPGAEPVFMIYDDRDRLVLTQDGNLRKTYTGTDLMKWTFTKYDQLNRPVLTGIYTADSVLNITAMQNRVNRYYKQLATNNGAWYETFSTSGAVHGYDNTSFPTTPTVDDYLTVTYYDNYSFKSLFTTASTSAFDFKSNELPAAGGQPGQLTSYQTNVMGLVTGSKVRSISAATWLRSVNYYDNKYRAIQVVAQNMKGHAVTTNVYDFTGKVLRTKTSTYTGQPVIWTNLTNAQVQGNELVGTNTSSWGGGASSTQVLPANTDGWVEYTITQTTSFFMVGLSDQDISTHYSTLDYAFYVYGTSLYIYEGYNPVWTSGNSHLGDRLRIERVGSKVHFKRNGFIVYTSATPSTSSLVMDVSFFQNNGRFADARISESFGTFAATPKTIVQRMDYDHAGRLIRNWHQIDAQPEVLLVHNTYNELGQLIDKRLHSSVAPATDARQSVDYRYNIRGWLTSINNAELQNTTTNDDSNDLFGMNLAYENDLGTGNANANPSLDLRQYNGNISAMKWSHQLGLGTTKEYGYNFTYDPLNRLKHARSVKNTNLSTPSWVTGEYHERNLTYDLNGNIGSLSRTGKDGLMDSLRYNYGGGSNPFTNKILYIFDDATNATVKRQGFLDGNTSGNDYSYDANGSLLTDKNKGIVNQMTYNHLNLVETLIKSTASMRYFYDATGTKYGQLMVQGNSQRLTEYIGPYVYENDELQFVQHPEGRIVYKTKEVVYHHSFSSTTDVAATADVTLNNETLNGETYLKVTAANGITLFKKGVTPVGGSILVTPGDRYTLRVKGYRNTYSVNLYVKGVNDLVWSGAALPGSANNEGWAETSFVVPQGVTAVTVGVLWSVNNTVTDYFYLNDLELVHHLTATPEYHYNLKDHLGNVRLTFTTKSETEARTATLEPVNQSAEQSNFLRYSDAKLINSTLFDHTNGASTGYSQRLNGTANEKYGLARSISVMPGDTVKMEVYAKYVDSNTSNWTSALNTLMSQIATSTTGVVVDGTTYTTSTASFPFGGLQNTSGSTGTGPKAYLNWLIFDRNYVLLDAGYQRMTTAAREYGQDVAHEKLSVSFTAKQPGYVYIYLSNEETSPVDVFFDDFKVTQVKSPVVQMEDYYPFGLTFNSYKRENSVANDYKYNGKEEQTALGLGWFDYGARMYQPELGRFGTIDKFADRFARYSPYNYATNNPVLFTDPDGNYPVNIVNANGVLTRSFMHLINTVLGVSYNTLADTRIRYDRDVWYHPHENFTGYNSGGITIHQDIILTNDFDTRGGSIQQTRSDVEKWFGLIPHELGHRVQRDRSLLYLTPYVLQAAGAAIQNGSVDANIIHDKIPMEVEAERYQQQFEEFFNFFNYKDKKGNNRNKITDLFSGGRKDDDYIISKLNEYKSEYDKAQEEEAKKKGEGLTSMVNNFSNLQEGTYTWNGSSWVRQ